MSDQFQCPDVQPGDAVEYRNADFRRVEYLSPYQYEQQRVAALATFDAMAKHATEAGEAEIRRRLIAKVRDAMEDSNASDGLWCDAIVQLAEVAVDVFTEAVRKGEL